LAPESEAPIDSYYSGQGYRLQITIDSIQSPNALGAAWNKQTQRAPDAGWREALSNPDMTRIMSSMAVAKQPTPMQLSKCTPTSSPQDYCISCHNKNSSAGRYLAGGWFGTSVKALGNSTTARQLIMAGGPLGALQGDDLCSVLKGGAEAVAGGAATKIYGGKFVGMVDQRTARRVGLE
jgi:hypothetical protein